MSNLSLDFSDNAFQPLAARMRPENLAQYIGQQHLLAPGKPLPRAIEAGHLHSMILWGPPGTGKTTLAEVIARYASADVERISAVTSGVKEIREAIERARQNRNAGRRTILFVDEVHRFNKSQQDAFLPHIEDGTITFIGATTENPSFELNSALLSRARVYLLKSLTTDDIERVLDQAMNDKTRGYGGQDIVLPDETRRAIAELVNGDARDRPDYDVPVHLRNAPTKLMKEMGYGQEYRYAHDEPNAYAAGEQYFPQEMAQTRYYHPTNRGLEGKIGEKLAWLAEQDQNSPIKRYR
ncbi:TPA: AAA family ATPase [Klebsiella pneumoniae]|nr:AAA family ATPase [Klebsiella pneumoniae]